jgi:methionyl-tRNA formyltransferase
MSCIGLAVIDAGYWGPNLIRTAPLPRYRGRTFVSWAIVNGKAEFALTIHVMSPELDTGNILCQRTVTIGPHDTAWQLMSRLNEVQREVLSDTVMRYPDGYEGAPQDQSAATYACQRVPADGEIDWSRPTDQIYALDLLARIAELEYRLKVIAGDDDGPRK